MKKRFFPTVMLFALVLLIENSGYCQAWRTLGSGVPSTVYSIVRYGGSIWAGGDSVYYWNGSRWVAAGDGMEYILGVGIVYSLAVYNDALFAGGEFTVLTPDGNWYNNVGRLENGQWTTCGSGKGNDGSGMSDLVYFLTAYNGSLYAGGKFTSAGGDPLYPQDAMYIAQFDGTQWNPVGGGMNDRITDMVVYNNQLVVSGYFTTAGGTNANYIASWDGTKWSPLGSGTDGKVTALAVHNGDLYAGGFFTMAGGDSAANVARWDGHSWSAVGRGLMGQVYTLASYNNKLYAGGNDLLRITSTTPPYLIEKYVMCWNGSEWDSLATGTNGPVEWLLPDSLGLIVGGSFTTAGGMPANNIAYLTTATSVKEPYIVPNQWSLEQNYPNPFNPSTVIQFVVRSSGSKIGPDRGGFVSLRVYDVLGREVATLVNGRLNTGAHSVVFDGSKLASGVYFYKLTAPGVNIVRKMLLAK